MQNFATIINGLIPHGYCLSWQPHLLWLHGIADFVTAVAYYSIPLMLLVFVKRRRDLQFSWIFVLFGVFIMACGATHVMSLWTMWHPDYLAAGIVKAITAVASIFTAAVLLPLIPKALALPGPAQWSAVNRQLSAEVAERREAEAEIRRLNTELERRVLLRTAELEAANRELQASQGRMRESQELLQAIIDNAGSVIFVKDVEGRYLLANRRFSELFHVDQAAMIGRTDYDVFPAATADSFRATDGAVVAAGCLLRREEIAPHDDGPHHYLSVKFPLHDAAGRLYAVGGIATDITERVQAEGLFRHVVEAAPSAMLLVGRDGRIAMANAQTVKLFGYDKAELLGQPIEMLVPQRHQARHPARLGDYFAAPTTRRMGGDRELHGLRKDGVEVPVEIGLNPVETHEGKMVLASIIDISERKQAEADRDARRAAEAASRAKSEFLSAMSHELRTPLNAILGYAQNLRRSPALTPQQAAGLSTIQQSGQHLLTLINDLLDLAKIEAGKFDLNPAPIAPAAFLKLVGDIIRVKAEEKSLLFSYEAPAELPGGLLVDEKRLRQVLLNLLGNAVKFTDRGEVRLEVAQVADDGEQVRLRFAVVDTGVGMAAEQLEQIFQPFEQIGEASRRAGGTGLGLAISRQLVRLMGSDIAVASTPGAGSRFSFELALPRTAAVAAPAPSRPVTGYRGARRTLLIADDVVGNRALLADLLGGLGFDLAEAVNGAEAVSLAVAGGVDLVLMDLVMPVMDGMEAIRRIRALPGRAALPIIALSASANLTDQEVVLAAGASDFLAKPLDQERLLALIAAHLDLAWSYDAPPEPATGAAGLAASDIPPPAELARLHELALAGDMRGIRSSAAELAARAPNCQAFADRLHQLAQNYQSKAILNLLTEQLQAQGATS